jgi:hypothetical protein
MYETEETTAPSGGAMDRLKKLLVGLLVVALLAVAGYLQVERNHRTYFTNTREGALVVLKGSYFLWGARPFVPDDPATAERYAPIPLPEGAAPIPDGRFDEREALDRYLFDLLAGWAEPRIRSGEAVRMKEGFLYVDRAARLTGLSGTQAKKLRELQAEVAYFEARDRIERAGQLLEEAREKLLLATEGAGYAREAAALLGQIEPANQVVAHALRSVRLGIPGAEGVKPAYYPVPLPVPAAPEAGNGVAPAPVVPALPGAVTPVVPAAPAAPETPVPAVPAPAPRAPAGGEPPGTVPAMQVQPAGEAAAEAPAVAPLKLPFPPLPPKPEAATATEPAKD